LLLCYYCPHIGDYPNIYFQATQHSRISYICHCILLLYLQGNIANNFIANTNIVIIICLASDAKYYDNIFRFTIYWYLELIIKFYNYLKS